MERSATGLNFVMVRAPSSHRPRVGIALAGGGPLGAIYEIGVLSALAEALRGFDFNDAEVYVGVSAGSFIAAGLANGYTPQDLSRLFIEDNHSEQRFDPALLLRPALGEYARRLASLPPLIAAAAWAYVTRPGNALGALERLGRALPTGLFDGDQIDRYLAIWPDELPPSREALLEKVRGVEGLLALLTDPVDAELMDAAGPQLQVISNFAVGYDNVDVAAATARGIPVGNTPGVLTETTADMAFALLMAAARRIVEGADYVRAGRWRTWGPTLLLGHDIHGATLGIVGMGRIGQALARRAAGFDMRIAYFDPYCDPNRGPFVDVGLRCELPDLLADADFVSLHVPLTTETRSMIENSSTVLTL